MLAEEFRGLMQISQSHLADALYFRCQRINELVNQTRGITPSTTLRLARFSACRPISG
jgi:plasmid maintenance system antidote protein VapI